MKRARGRPREFEENAALEAAAQLFWTKGLRGTSLDDLSAAMEMNRPSIYNAFGNKEALYRRALQHFGHGMETAFARTMGAEKDIRRGLTSFYQAALSTYSTGDVPRGCMVMSTAATAATSHPEVRSDLLAMIRQLDRKIARRLQRAIDDGQLPPDFDVAGRAAMAQSVLHTLSLRSRAGETPGRLRAIVATGVDLILH